MEAVEAVEVVEAVEATERDGFRAACPRPDRCVFHGNPQSQLMKQDFSRQAC